MADMSIGGADAFGVRSGRALTLAGGFVSLALIAGVAVWGVKLVMRDVNGIPVVRAVAAEMRVLPEDPGGAIADHEGLSVNAVAAAGAAEPVAPRVSLAPEESGLTEEDLQPLPATETPQSPELTAQAAGLSEPPTGPSDQAPSDTQALIDQLIASNTETPLEPVATDDTSRVTIMVNGQPVETRRDPQPGRAGVIPASVPGVARALRPVARPADLSRPVDPVAQALAASVAASSDTSIQVTPDGAIPAGTHLAQLSAQDTPEAALRDWDRLAGLFPEYFQGKSRVIQKTERDGRAFYRLRVSGFEGESDARRFCSAIKAGAAAASLRQDCLHVVVR